MLYEYKSATGTVKIEVDEKWAKVLAELDRQEKNNNHTETRRHSPLNTDEGEWIAYNDPNIEALFNDELKIEDIKSAVLKLKGRQKEVIIGIYYRKKTQQQLTYELGVTKQAISKIRKAAEKNLKNFLQNG